MADNPKVRGTGPSGSAGGSVTTGSSFGVNVVDGFGADPNGGSDSVAAFEAAMMSRRVADGRSYGQIWMPQGRYRFSRALNLEIGGPQFGVSFLGECQISGDGGGGTVILGPADDYAFRQKGIPQDINFMSNPWNQVTFENFCILGYGGLQLDGCSPTIRNVCTQCWRGIVATTWGISTFENIIIRGNGVPPGGPIKTNDINKGQIGLWVYSNPGSRISQVEAQQFYYGTAVGVAGPCNTVENLHIETSRQGLLAGTAPPRSDGTPGQNYAGQLRIAESGFEACLIAINMSNCGSSEVKQINIQGHDVQLPEGPSWAFCGLFLNNADGCQIEAVSTGSGFTQGAIVGQGATPPAYPQNYEPWPVVIFPNEDPQPQYGLYRNKAICKRLAMDCFYPLDKSYPAGSRNLGLLRGQSVQLPMFLTELKTGTQVKDAFGTGIAAGTTVVSVSGNSVTLSQPTTAAVTSVRFYDAQGAQLGLFDYRYPHGGAPSPGTIGGGLAPI